jgi:hypothetical protein
VPSQRSRRAGPKCAKPMPTAQASPSAALARRLFFLGKLGGREHEHGKHAACRVTSLGRIGSLWPSFQPSYHGITVVDVGDGQSTSFWDDACRRTRSRRSIAMPPPPSSNRCSPMAWRDTPSPGCRVLAEVQGLLDSVVLSSAS